MYLGNCWCLHKLLPLVRSVYLYVVETVAVDDWNTIIWMQQLSFHYHSFTGLIDLTFHTHFCFNSSICCMQYPRQKIKMNKILHKIDKAKWRLQQIRYKDASEWSVQRRDRLDATDDLSGISSRNVPGNYCSRTICTVQHRLRTLDTSYVVNSHVRYETWANHENFAPSQ